MFINYVIDGYNSIVLPQKETRMTVFMVFAKHSLSTKFLKYNFVDANILKRHISTIKVPINLVCTVDSR